MNQFVSLIGVLSIALFHLFLASCSATLPENEPAPEEEEPVEQEVDPLTIKRTDLQLLDVKNAPRPQAVSISGRVIPRNTTQLFAEVQGLIEPTSKVFKEGINFKEGEVIIQISQREFQLGLEAQRAAFLNALTGILPDLKSDYPESYDQWYQYVKGYTFGASLRPLPEPQSDQERFLLTTNQVFSTYFQIKAQEERLQKFTIKAPCSGTIVQSNIDVGGLVSPGQALGTISNRYHFELEAGMPLSVASTLNIGDQIEFKSNQVKGTWAGRVARINNLVDPSTQNIPVYFTLKGKGLRSGMYLEGMIQATSSEAVATIPNGAFGRDESVLVLQNGIISRKSVEPVEFLEDSLVVRGLGDQDLVIINQFDIPVEGVKVAQ